MRRKRVLIPVATLVAIVVLLLALVWSELLTARYAQGTFSMAPALPACNGRVSTSCSATNRSVFHDSRDVGAVPRGAIFARVVLVFWPSERFGVPPYDKTREPLGLLCGAGS